MLVDVGCSVRARDRYPRVACYFTVSYQHCEGCMGRALDVWEWAEGEGGRWVWIASCVELNR